jgi:sulfide:quinone oxidoreductase
MARLLIMGAGVSGHTAALHAHRKLKRDHEVVVVSPNSRWNWIPSNIWVGVGFMNTEQVTFDLAPVYKKTGIPFYQAKATAIYPEGNQENPKPFIEISYTSPERMGEKDILTYDYLINATGPRLRFDKTEGLGPDNGYTTSVCTPGHAEHAFRHLEESIERMKRGEQQKIVIGTGHGTCTCQGAAFEYLFNVEYLMRKQGVRDKAHITWITNEMELGDFGMGGMHIKRGGYVTHSRIFTESLFTERGISWIKQAGVKEIQENKFVYETLDGKESGQEFDFSMLLPPFTGVPFQAFNKKGEEITDQLFAPNGFMKVDADYSGKPYDEWSPKDWPETYQNTAYSTIFAVGIAFAPPHAISKPAKSTNGMPISPTPPRTGMPSGVMAREVAFNIVDMIKGDAEVPVRKASMAKMGAACIASAGANALNGTAVSMTMYPIIPDFETYPDTGRSLRYTTGEIGLAGHWIKHLLHFGFMYKAKANPFWRIIPE